MNAINPGESNDTDPNFSPILKDMHTGCRAVAVLVNSFPHKWAFYDKKPYGYSKEYE